MVKIRESESRLRTPVLSSQTALLTAERADFPGSPERVALQRREPARHHVDMVEEFAYALEYLVRLVGADTPVHLQGIARALCLVNWDLPQPKPVTPKTNVFGFSVCLCEQACLALDERDDDAPRKARALLEPFPSKKGLLKMCLIHDRARLSRGYRLVATRGDNGVAAYVPNRVISEDEAYSFLKQGWRCLFVDV